MLPGRPGTPPGRFGRCGACAHAGLVSVRASGRQPIHTRKVTAVTRIVAMLRNVARGGVRHGPVAGSAQAALRRRQPSMYSMHSSASETSA